MIKRVSESKDKQEVLDLMEPLISEWFDSKFDSLTEPQGYAIPQIHEMKNVLVSSPTGSGKTLTAFLSIINELFKLDKKGELEDKIYCVYVSPLKALANDIHKNLERPLEEIRKLAEEKDVKIPRIKTAIRSGDTPQKERRKMVTDPPHIFITTPESLGLILSSPKFREKFDDVRYFIMDEIHDICSSKRGVFLSLNTERLEKHVKGKMTRIGLSATQAPIEEIAKFLGGFEDERPREVNIIEVTGEKKRLDLSVISPVDDMTLLPYEVVNSRMYDTLTEMVENHRTTLIFTNTRSGAENVSYKLQERGIEDIAAHHGSLSKETRIEVEDNLKDGELTSAVSSTSLELGIDVGYIDLVVQVGSPKSVAKGLQRVGRAGHAVGKTSKGRMIVFEKDDLVECSVLTKQAYEHEIDRVDIPTNNLDVLSQGIIGMSLEKRWGVEEAFETIRKAYCYHELSKDDYLNVLDFLSGNRFENVYPKIWYNSEEGVFGKKGGVQMIYYLNIGTIPSDSNYRVYSNKGVPLGKLSEKFVERLSHGDVFVLGGHSYEFSDTKGTRLFVKDAAGKKPTVPSWTGEMLPRSFDLSVAIGKFRRKLAERVEQDDVLDWLMEDYSIDKGSAQTIVSYFKEQLGFTKELPSDKQLVIEGFVDQKGHHNIIFHACFGRRVNDALSRAYAYKISKRFNCTTNVSVTDDNFMISVKKKIPLGDVSRLVTSDNIEQILKRAVRSTEMFKQRFRHCASRAMMILRNYKGRDISVSKQKYRSKKILNVLHRQEDFPIIKETYNEILYQVLDMGNAREVLNWIENGMMDVKHIDYNDTPSPFAHNIIMAGISDVIMMDDKSALLRQFHQKVLEQVIPEEEIEKFKFDADEVEEHYFEKKPKFNNKEEMLQVVKELQPIHVFKEKGESIYQRTERSFEEVRNWAKELLNEGKIQSIWVGDVKYVSSEYVNTILNTLDQGEQPHGAGPVLKTLRSDLRTVRDIYDTTDLRLKDVKNLIRDLERKRLVNRRGITDDGEYIYGLLDKKDIEVEKVEELIMDYLEYHVPQGLEEIAYALSLPEDRALLAMNNLVDRGKIVSGKLVVGEGKQYMLKEDYHSLRFPGKEQVGEEKVDQYSADKKFSKLNSIRDYFEKFGEAGMSYDVYKRMEDFSLEKWDEMRESGEILEGRFVRGRVRYVLKEDVPMYVGAYRDRRLNENEEKVFNVIKNGDAHTLREIKREVDLKNEHIKEIVKELDKNLYIKREYTGDDSWSSRNQYKPIEVDPLPREKAIKKVIKRFLRGNGPISISDLRYQTRFHGREVDSAVSEMVRDGEAIKVRVGASQRELYILSDELDKLKSAEEDEFDELRIVSKKDPATRSIWTDVYARYGDDWVFPLIKRGKMVGAIEKWNMSGCIEIRHIDLDDGELLEDTLDAIEEMMEYHRLDGYDIVRIRNFQNTSVEELDDDVLNIFKKKGYEQIQGMLVKGNILKEVYSNRKLISYVFYRQRLNGDKYTDIKEALKSMKGARSDYEVRARTEGFYSLDWLHRRGEIYSGQMVPPYHMYAYPKDIAVYKAAKAIELDNVDRTILEIVSNKSPVPSRTIYHRSPYSKNKTGDSIKKLYKGLYICKDHNNRYVLTLNNYMDKKIAKKKVVKWTFDNFGIFTAERLSSYLGSSFKMADLRDILSELVDERYLVKGFLKEDSDKVHWMLAEGKDKLSDIEFDKKVVITQKDRLNLYFRDWIKDEFDLGTCFVVFDGTELAAAFNATIKEGMLNIKQYEGPNKYRRIIKKWAFENNMSIRRKKKKKRVSDYEVQKWYERTRGI
ncbi:MAG: ATP-dependent helicase [Candidatus Saliniplasma sp.]